ncbi:hypothetical protein NEMIN01_0979 [Nematocida minor]|uniref:uncharacterized protein n=1 Tax=Nematocida minor TaxID=1912983 RepID=UPI00221FB04F|nr:uncharacterized protein NEMIN01_0979 [Nematocida minor]KAI5190280.1 hypothetical protein NEMIN01_0979 [Nematocida minor]
MRIEESSGKKERKSLQLEKEEERVLDFLDTKKNMPAYVLKRFLVQTDDFVWFPMIRISCSVSHSKFKTVLVPTEEVRLRFEILGKIIEMNLFYGTTTSDILHAVWRNIGIIKGFDENEFVLSFDTSNSCKILGMEDRPLLEILQWKLNNSLLKVVGHRLTPANKLFKNCGFEMRIIRKHQVSIDIQNKLDCPHNQIITYANSLVPLLPLKEKTEQTVDVSMQKQFIITCITDAMSFSFTIMALMAIGSNPFLYKLETIKNKLGWLLNILGAVFMMYLLLPQLLELFFGEAPKVRPHLPVARPSEVNLEVLEEEEVEIAKDISLNLSHMGLTSIPEVVFTTNNIAHLDISYNVITVLPEKLNSIGLKSINASNNKISSIPQALRIPNLNLASNHLTEFESNYIYVELNLLGNPLQKFKGHAERLYIRTVFSARRIYSSLSSLKKISIIDVEMKKFVGKFPFLVDLQLVNNSLEEISVLAPNLKTLLCAHNFLLQFPYIEQKKGHVECHNLISLSLPYNSLNIIPSRIWTLPIEYLNVSHNQIVRIDPAVRQTSLLHLNISGNQIKEIDNISRLAGLICFISSFNMLESVCGLDVIPGLKMVDLSYNMLRVMPKLPNKEIADALSFYALGNLYMPCPQSKVKRLANNGVNVFLGEMEENLIKVPGIVGIHSRCLECGAYIPKERARKEEERKKVRATRRAHCIVRELMTQPYNTGDKSKAANVKIFAYFSSKNKQIKSIVDKTLSRMAKYLQTESGGSLYKRFVKHRQRLREFCIDIKHKMFPTKVDILCFIITADKYICSIGSSDIDLVLFRDERGVYLCNTPYLSTAGLEKRKTDECLMAFPKSVLQEISVTDLIVAYKRSRSTTEVQRFIFSHELRDVSVFIVPLIPKVDHPMRKEPDSTGLKILEELSAHNIASQFIRVPIVIFTDIVNSTKLWTKDSIKMMQMVKIHNNTVRSLMRRLGGYEVKTEGDAFMMIFYDEQCAMEFGAEIHRILLRKNWPEMGIEYNPLIYSKTKPLYRGLQIRVGISKGACVVENDPITKRLDFYGKSVIEAARLCSMASAGETLITHTMYNRVKDIKTRRYIIMPRGRVILSGLESEIHHVYEVLHSTLLKRLLLKSPRVIRGCGWIIT